MDWSGRVVYLVLIPAIVIAAGVLGYYSLQSAQQYAQMSEQSVLSTTLLLVDEKVDRIEQMVISADEAVFHLVDPREPHEFEESWPPLADRLSPSVRSVVVLDDGGNVMGYQCRCTEQEREDFLKVFTERILGDLALHEAPEGQLRHLHRTYGDLSYLVSYRALRHEGRRIYVAAHHDTGYIVREVFPDIFVNEDRERRWNVVDEDNHLIYGPRVVRAGDYLVGRSFPTTFYGWRMQVAPKAAPALREGDQTRRYTETSLIGLALAVLLLGIGFLIYAATKESRVNALRSEFIANVSHELKTPLSVVRMFSEMLLTDRVRDDKKRRQYLETILRESERLSALIENVLDFSAIERGKEAYEFREGDLGEVVGRAIETYRSRLEPGFPITLERKGDIPTARFDEQALLLALLNLLDNAVKYGNGSPVTVTIERGRRHVYLRVRDEGPGIPSEHHKRVFERFFRVRGAGSEIRGSGIGLALVKRIAEAHGGRAWVETPDGGGAQVSFSVRAAASAAPEPATEAA
jgi:two-component system, OmpR family, phosphate regulon sensor histidine kinase PhoR